MLDGRKRETLVTYGRGPPGPVVNGVLRTPDGVVNLRPKAKLRPRKAVALPKEEEEENKSEIKQLQEKARTWQNRKFKNTFIFY